MSRGRWLVLASLWALACGSAHASDGPGAAGGAPATGGGAEAAASGMSAAASAGTSAAGSAAEATSGASFGGSQSIATGGDGAVGGTQAGGGSPSQAGGGGAGGGTLRAIHCPSPPPPCSPNVYEGNVVVGSHMGSAKYAGVTAVTGDVDIQIGDDLEAFDCLETVGGMFVAYGSYGMANAFPRLRSVGTFMQLSSTLNLPADCALGSLAVVGAAGPGDITVSGFVGELNLSSLTHFGSLTIQSTALARVLLPSTGSFTLTRLWLISTGISELRGFENVSLKAPNPIDPNLVPLIATTNRRLSGCRIQQLEQLFSGAGFDAQTFKVSDNGASCE